MARTFIGLFLACCALTANLSAEAPFVSDKRLDLIDKAYDKCIGTMNDNTCAQAFYDSQDKLLNEVYGSLKHKLKGERLSKLNASQKEWNKYKTKEFEFIDAIYPLVGSMFNSMRTYRKGRVLLRRSQELIFYEDLLTEFAGDYEGEE